MRKQNHRQSDREPHGDSAADSLKSSEPSGSEWSRRDFVKAAAVTAAAGSVLGSSAWAAGSDVLKVGLIGCGGRGTGAAFNSLEASERIHIAALADLFPDRLSSSRSSLQGHAPDRATVPDSQCYIGFDAYKNLIRDSGVDIVILATPPHFRSIQFEEAVRAGKHVFMEKPVATDPVGIRRVIANGEIAKSKGLSVVAGTQRRHEKSYLVAMKKIEEGLIGEVISARVYWNQGGLWVKEHQPEWSDMEWQIRNWLYFTWASGDHIVEQHVHNIDVSNWVMGGPPVRCLGMGGRQSRTEAKYGNIFDHFAIEFEYPNGQFTLSMCRQADGAAGRVQEVIHGSKGTMILRPGFAVAQSHAKESDLLWRYRDPDPSPYVLEHVDLIDSISNNKGLNEAKRVAESTLSAIMGRMSAYTGQAVTWEQALNSKLDLAPESGYEFTDLSVRPVAIPGTTPLI